MRVIKLVNEEYFSSNVYLYVKDNHALIIDLGFYNEELRQLLKEYIIDGIIITHKHFDHIQGLKAFQNDYKNVNVYSNLKDKNYFIDSIVNCSKNMSDFEVVDYQPLNTIHLDEGKIKIGVFNLNIIYTPGHLNDCICIADEMNKVLFSGDFMFSKMIGRCDLPTGNMLMMFKSIEKIIVYLKNKELTIYSGHDESSFTTSELFKENIYFKRKIRG